MAPDIPRYFHSDGADLYGTGSERFSFRSLTDEVRSWWVGTRENQFITPEMLQQAPDSTVALIREIVRQPLLEEMTIGELEKPYQNSGVNQVMEEIMPSRLIQVEEIRQEPWDDNRTTNYILPLITDKGIIEIIVNPAWGISWRLGKDHPILEEHPQLARTQNEDLSQAPKKQDDWRGYPEYVDVEVLAQAAKFHPEKLIVEIKNFLIALFLIDDLTIKPGGLIAGINHPIEQCFKQIVFESKSQRTNFQLGLGNEHGSRRVDTFGFKKPRDHGLTALARKAKSLKAQISSI